TAAIDRRPWRRGSTSGSQKASVWSSAPLRTTRHSWIWTATTLYEFIHEETTMITNYFRKTVSIVLFLTVASLAAPAGTITYRFVAGTALYQQPTLLTEVLPGVFYSSGVNEVAFSVTPQGQLTSLANFNPSSLQHWFVTGANGRAYNSISGIPGNVVSIGLSPGT